MSSFSLDRYNLLAVTVVFVMFSMFVGVIVFWVCCSKEPEGENDHVVSQYQLDPQSGTKYVSYQEYTSATAKPSAPPLQSTPSAPPPPYDDCNASMTNAPR